MILTTRATLDACHLSYIAICFFVFAQVPQDELPMTPVKLFVCCAVISTIAGIASVYRTYSEDKQITSRLLLSHAINMGTCGASISMVVYAILHPRENLEWMIIGGAGLFSLGGMPMIQWAIDLAKSVAQKFSKGEINE